MLVLFLYKICLLLNKFSCKSFSINLVLFHLTFLNNLSIFLTFTLISSLAVHSRSPRISETTYFTHHDFKQLLSYPTHFQSVKLIAANLHYFRSLMIHLNLQFVYLSLLLFFEVCLVQAFALFKLFSYYLESITTFKLSLLDAILLAKILARKY